MNMRLNPNGSNEFWNEDIDIRYSVKLLLGGCCWNKGMDSHYLDLEDSGDMQLYNPMAKCLLVCLGCIEVIISFQMSPTQISRN